MHTIFEGSSNARSCWGVRIELGLLLLFHANQICEGHNLAFDAFDYVNCFIIYSWLEGKYVQNNRFQLGG